MINISDRRGSHKGMSSRLKAGLVFISIIFTAVIVLMLIFAAIAAGVDATELRGLNFRERMTLRFWHPFTARTVGRDLLALSRANARTVTPDTVVHDDTNTTSRARIPSDVSNASAPNTPSAGDGNAAV